MTAEVVDAWIDANRSDRRAFDFDAIDDMRAALDPVRVAIQTYGARFAGERGLGAVKLGYVLAHARQHDNGNNPLTIDLGYSLAELSATWRALNAGLGWEVLEGNGQVGFSAPRRRGDYWLLSSTETASASFAASS